MSAVLKTAPRSESWPVSEGRLRQLDRMLLIVTLLAPLRHGVTLAGLVQEVNEECPACERTISRDLIYLVSRDHVTRSKEPDGRTLRYTWNSDSVRGVILRHWADVREAAL